MNLVFLQRGRLYWALAILLMGISCGNPREGQSVQNGNVNSDIEITASIPAKRLLNYWDGFNIKARTETTNLDDPEQKLVDFIALFPTVPDTVVQILLLSMLKKGSITTNTFD